MPTTGLGRLLPAAEFVFTAVTREVFSIITVQLAVIIWSPFKAVFRME